MRQKRHRPLMMPTTPSAGCIMIHAQCCLACFQRGLDRPAQPTHPYQGRAWTLGRCVPHVVLDLRPWLQTPSEDEPHLVARTASALARCPHTGERSRDRPCAPFLARGLSPIVLGQLRAALLHFWRFPCAGGHTQSGAWRSPRALAWRDALHLLRPDIGRLWGPQRRSIVRALQRHRARSDSSRSVRQPRPIDRAMVRARPRP